MTVRLEAWYRANAQNPTSDIAAHFPALLSAVRSINARTVVELGVREGHSSSALLLGLVTTGGTLWSVDIEEPNVPELSRGAPPWHVIVGDDRDPNVAQAVPEAIDVLFIDTDHDYEHTHEELETYGLRVRPGGFILAHDTANEDPAAQGVAIGSQPAFPVRRAIEEWTDRYQLPWRNDPRSWGLGTIYV